MYYPCSENKGADQLRCYREADLQLCFCICRLLVFSQGGSFVAVEVFSYVALVHPRSPKVQCFSEEYFNMSHIIGKPDFAYGKTKEQISCAITAKLIMAFVFATQIVQFHFYLNQKFQVSSILL